MSSRPPHLDFALLTPQEGNFIGGTYSEGESRQPYMPIGVARGLLTPEEAQKIREDVGFYSGYSLQGKLRLPGEVVMSLEKLDPNTGETKQDPKVLGYWAENTGEIVEVKERNLTAEVYRILREQEEDSPILKHFLREKPNNVEGQDSGGTESKN